MGVGPATRKPFTVEDLFSLPDDGKRYEIYGGEPYMVLPFFLDHQHVSMELQYALTHHVKTQRLGVVYAAPIALVLDDVNYTEPDLMFVSNARRAVLTPRGVEGAPDLVVEIHSPSTKRRDLEIKRMLYARAGIPQYWLVDPIARSLVVLELAGEEYREVVRHGADDVFRPTLFPGLAIELSEIWLTLG